MGYGYTRQAAADIQTGLTVEAAPINQEFNQLQNVFDSTYGHTHDGTLGEGPKISLTASITGILPVDNGGIGGVHKTNAIVAPTASDDVGKGYKEGSIWIDTLANIAYICVDSSNGAAIWVTYQIKNAALSSISGLLTSADKMIYTTGSDTYAVTGLTPYARTLLDDVDAPTTRTTLGLGNIATQDSASVSVTGGTLTGVTLNSWNSSSATITGGTITGITDLAVADGGTGASTASQARTNLGLAIGTDVQAYSAPLASIAGLTTTSNQMIYTTGSNAYATTTLTPFVRTLLDDVDANAFKTTISLNNVDNTSDVNKPISSAVQSALNQKADVTTLITYVPSGAVMQFAMTSAPTGWLKCNGQAVSRSTYSALFSAIGTTWGSGDGSTTFNLPDLRGEFIRGLDDGRGVDTGRALGTSQSSQNLAHTHGITDSGHQHTNYKGGAYTERHVFETFSHSSLNAVPADTNTSINGTSITINSSGGSEARPRNIALLYCIKY